MLNQDLTVFLGGDFFSKALSRAVSSYHMNNRDIGLLVLEMPSSFSYAKESFYWDLSSPDISLFALFLYFTSMFCSSSSNAVAIAVVAQGLGFHRRTWILLHLGGRGCHRLNNTLPLQ